MKRRCFLLLCGILLSGVALPQSTAQSRIELVESIPLETTLDNPDIRNTLDVWLAMINAARSSLDIEQLYVSNKQNEPLEDVIRAIEQAAQRGVNVRLIADARFYKIYPETVDRLAKKQHISTRIINFGKLAGGVQHAKFFIVDKEEVFLGSQNFDWRALKHIHELGLRIRHPDIARFYLDIFNLDWELAQSNDRAVLPNALVPRRYAVPWTMVQKGDTLRLIPTASPKGFLPDTNLWDEPHIIRLIDEAEREVSLQFLGYDTRARNGGEYRLLDDALRRAAARGVRVHLLVSDWEKGTPAERALKSLSTVKNIEVKFSVLPEWGGGYIPFARVAHCKFIVADRRAFWLGTSNAEHSYFHTSRNVGAVVIHAGLAARLHAIFDKSWNGPYVEIVEPTITYERRKHDGE